MLVRVLEPGRCGCDSLGDRAALVWSEKALDQLTAVEWSREDGALMRVASPRVRGTKPKRRRIVS